MAGEELGGQVTVAAGVGLAIHAQVELFDLIGAADAGDEGDGGAGAIAVVAEVETTDAPEVVLEVDGGSAIAPETKGEGAVPFGVEDDGGEGDAGGDEGGQAQGEGEAQAGVVAEQDGEGDGEVEGQTESERGGQSEQGEEDETGERGAEHGTDGIDGEHHADTSSGTGNFAGGDAGSEGKGHAEQQGGSEHDGEADGELEELVDPVISRAAGEDFAEAIEAVGEEVVKEHGGEQEESEREFDPAEGVEGAFESAPATDQPGTGGDAGDEGGEHDGEGVGGGAEGEGEHAGPDHLVEHGNEAGDTGSDHGEAPFEGSKRGSVIHGRRGGRGAGARWVVCRLVEMGIPQAGLDEQGENTDEGIEGGGSQQGNFQAEGGDPPEVSGDDADHGAETVDEVEAGDASAQFAQRPGHEAGEDGKGSTHEGGRDENGHQPEEELQRQQRRVVGFDAGGDGAVSRLTELEVEGEADSVDGDSDFEPTVKGQGATESIGVATEPGIAEGESAHERHQDGHDPVTGGAQKEGEVSGPHDLVHQPGHTGEQEAPEGGRIEPT